MVLLVLQFIDFASIGAACLQDGGDIGQKSQIDGFDACGDIVTGVHDGIAVAMTDARHHAAQMCVQDTSFEHGEPP